MLSVLKELFSIKTNIYITDLLDTTIIAIIIYSIILFLRRTRSYLVFLGLAITASLYILSKTINLYLTFFTLRYFVSVAAVIFVIIFQSEIRKYLEILGLIGSRQIKVGKITPKSHSTAEIVQACVQMAQSKMGALIVIQGNDDTEAFLEGGTTLDGLISEDVLLSIFDPHSQGHDGALIISNNRISKFSTHLPLSTNFKEIGKHGTRHSAALGLSESTDALCIVVSEEKKEISICKEGRMKTLKQFTDLEKELNKYIKAKFEPFANNSISSFLKHNSKLKIASMSLAILVWFLTSYQAGFVEKVYKVPIILEDVPKDTIVENYSPKEINLTVTGRGEAIFAGVSNESFKIMHSAAEIQDGVNKESILKKDIIVPPNLKLLKYEPETFLLTSQKYYEVKVPVTPQITGELQEGLELKSVEITPENISLWVLQDSAAPEEIKTEILDISNEKESVILPVKITIPENATLENGDDTVNVALTIEEKTN